MMIVTGTKELLEPFFAHVHEQASAEGGKVGGIGFCWGSSFFFFSNPYLSSSPHLCSVLRVVPFLFRTSSSSPSFPPSSLLRPPSILLNPSPSPHPIFPPYRHFLSSTQTPTLSTLGARYIAQLTFPPSSSASSTRTSQLAACVAYHPSFVQIPTELNLLASPTFFALASHDEMIFPPESIEQTRKVFEERRTSSKEEAGEGLDLKVKVYEKVSLSCSAISLFFLSFFLSHPSCFARWSTEGPANRPLVYVETEELFN
jgi:hypothetical protein